MSDLIKHITDEQFDSEVLQAKQLTLVDLWAPWCGPCKAIAPILDDLANEYQDQLKICKINVDENRLVASQHNVRSIPTLLLFSQGELVDTLIGSADKAALIKFISKKF